MKVCIKLYNYLRPTRTYRDTFESATFSFPIQKFPRPHVSGFKSNLPVHTFPTRFRINSSTQDSSGNIGNRACVVKRTKFACCSAFHSKELGLILLRHRVKKFPDLVSTRFQIHSVFKNFHSEERIQKTADSYAVFTEYVWTEAVSGKKKLLIQKYPDTCVDGVFEATVCGR